MNAEEAKRFLSDCAFVAFPSVRQWLLSTEKYNETFDMWVAGLAKLTEDECRAVITEWVAGTIPPPRFLRDTFVAELRACVLELRRRNAPAVTKAETIDVIRKTDRNSHVVFGSDCWKNDWLPLKSMVDSGELEPSEAMRQFRLILDERFKVRAAAWNG